MRPPSHRHATHPAPALALCMPAQAEEARTQASPEEEQKRSLLLILDKLSKEPVVGVRAGMRLREGGRCGVCGGSRGRGVARV